MLGLFLLIICLIPFAIALVYFFMGLRSLLIGRHERNKSKIIGGYNAMFLAFMALVLVYFIWLWLGGMQFFTGYTD